MRGDVNKPQSTFSRWIDWFYDGAFRATAKGKHRTSSQSILKRNERRWRRRTEKQVLKGE